MQSEIFSIMANHVVRDIGLSIKEAKCISVMADEVTDNKYLFVFALWMTSLMSTSSYYSCPERYIVQNESQQGIVMANVMMERQIWLVKSVLQGKYAQKSLVPHLPIFVHL